MLPSTALTLFQFIAICNKHSNSFVTKSLRNCGIYYHNKEKCFSIAFKSWLSTLYAHLVLIYIFEINGENVLHNLNIFSCSKTRYDLRIKVYLLKVFQQIQPSGCFVFEGLELLILLSSSMTFIDVFYSSASYAKYVLISSYVLNFLNM